MRFEFLELVLEFFSRPLRDHRGCLGVWTELVGPPAIRHRMLFARPRLAGLFFGRRQRRYVSIFCCDNGSGSGSIVWASAGQCPSIIVFAFIPTLCGFILCGLAPNTGCIAFLSKPLLVPSFRPAIIGPEAHDRRLDLIPFIARQTGKPGKDFVVIGQVAMRPPPCFHEQQQVCAVLHRRQHPRVGKVGVGPEGESGKLSHQPSSP